MSKLRPPSAQSRRAWESIDHGVPNVGGAVPYDDEEVLPTAMEREFYQDAPPPPRLKVSAPPMVAVPQTEQSGWTTFKKGVRSIWSTRHTEDTKHNKELHIKTALRELIIYIVFLVVLCIITFGMTSAAMYYFTSGLVNLFIAPPAVGQQPWTTFTGINSPSDLFQFIFLLLIPGVYTNWETYYNGVNLTGEDVRYVFYDSKVLGVPRIRQLRVTNNSCIIPQDFQGQIHVCYGQYSTLAEDRTPYGMPYVNGTAWTYQTESELGGSSYTAQVATYEGGGYVQDLGMDTASSVPLVQTLFDYLWIDRATRVVFIDFTVYNANINLFCVMKFIIEFPATGGAIPTYTFRTVKLLRYVSPMDFFVLGCECIFCIFILYYIVEEVLEIKRHRLEYLMEFWNVLDIVVILIALCCIAFNAYRTLSINSRLDKLLINPDQFANFEFISYWQEVFNEALAIMNFFAWIKIFKYISFNKTMTQLSTTLGACAKDLIGFAIMFFIVFLAFVQLGYLIFGTQLVDFSTFTTSMFSLFRTILGDSDFQGLQRANRVLGPIFFITYVFFVFFVLLNMFLAIINDTYSEVKDELANQKNEFDMADYFKQSYGRVLAKLRTKQNKIDEIENVLRSADGNKDQQIDFEEWRRDLKARGYSDAEIENVFSRYDTDGDRHLNASEMKKMRSDLEGQRMMIKTEISALERSEHAAAAAAAAASHGELTHGAGLGAAAGGFEHKMETHHHGRHRHKLEEEEHRRETMGPPPVDPEEFSLLQRRVERMENSIGSIVSKIDAVLGKLDAMERAKAKRKETMLTLLNNITEADGTSDETKRQQMEQLVRDELDKWDIEPIIGSGSSQGPSPNQMERRTSPNSAY